MNTLGAFALAGGVCLFLSACGGSGDLSVGDPQTSGYAYIAVGALQSTQTPGTVEQYAVRHDGSFTSLSAGSIAVGPDPQSIVSDPSGHYIYVVNGDATISQFAVSSGGGLVALSPATVDILIPASSAAVYSATVDPVGRFLYVVASPLGPLPTTEVHIAEFAIGTGGQLTALNPAYITPPINAGGPLAIDSNGTHAYVAGAIVDAAQSSGQIVQFSIANNGTLAELTLVTITTPAPSSAIALNGHTAYLLSPCVDTTPAGINPCDGEVTQYTVHSDGSLAPTGATTDVGSHVIPISLLTNASGSAAYLLTNLMGVDTNMGAVYQYAINSAGGLTPDSPASLSVASGSVAQGILGSDLHVLSSNSIGFASGSPHGGHVDHYTIGSDGLLSFASTTSVAADGFPTAITLVAAH